MKISLHAIVFSISFFLLSFFIRNETQAQTCDAHFAHYSINNVDSVHFYPSSTSALTYYWSFGDGTTSTSIAPWHYYTSAGTYHACLTVTNSSGVTCDWCDTIHIGSIAPCSAEFHHYSLNANSDSLHFYPVVNTGAHYYWNFGDGSYSADLYPWHGYTHPGTYYVCLYVGDTSGVTCHWCDTIHVGPTPTCNAHFGYYAGSNADSVHYYASSTSGTSYYWNFGDGTYSTQNNSWHFYTHPGTYNVCLTVVDASGLTCDWCDNIVVGTVSTCNAHFTHYTNSNPDSLHFYPQSTAATSYHWNFGDGTTSSSTAPWHYFTTGGTYYVCLTVADNAGNTCTFCDTVHVASPSCSAAFSHYSISNPDSIHFYPTGSGITNYYWSFGDGTYSTILNPWHYYANAGTYNACLTVVTTGGGTCTHCDTVHIATVPACNAEFIHYPLNNTDSIHFYPSNTSGTSYYWNFGDGSTSTQHTPWHNYASAGTYYVCLYIVTSNGTCNWCDTVHVGTVTTCSSQFAHYAISHDSLHFYPTGPAATSYYWNFGDGSTYSSEHYPWHHYTAAGTYTVCLYTVDATGATCHWCDTVHIGTTSTCNAQFYHYSIGSNPDSVHFYHTGTTGAYYWSFGDGASSTSMYPWHYYANAGTYYACLTVADTAVGITCTWCDTVHVAASTICNAEFSHYSLTNLESVHFYPHSTSATSYYWNFGDGTTSTSITPWHYYTHAGTFYACLTVVSSSGATCTSCDTIHIGTPSTCNAHFYHYSLNSTSDSVHFYTSAGATAYYWNFGDGTTSTQLNPWHNYTSAGTYHACLTIVDAAGNTCDWCDTVHVGTVVICDARFEHDALTGNPDSLHFYSVSTNATSYYWSFGDDSTSTGHTPWHYYSEWGTYYACLTIVNSVGATCSWCDTVHAGPASQFMVRHGHYSSTNPDSLHFYPTGSIAVAYYWNFGDGYTSGEQTPWHKFLSAGTYEVCIMGADVTGEVSEWCDMVNTSATGIPVIPQTEMSVKIYPNPMNESAIVSLTNIQSGANFSLYEITGKLIMRKENLLSGDFTINTKNISAGLYFFSVVSDSKMISTGRLMIVH